MKARNDFRLRMAYFKNRPCFDCQGWFEPCQMDFDHRPNEIKRFELCHSTQYSMRNVALEAKKCDLVCANCHRLRTKRRMWKWKPNGARK